MRNTGYIILRILLIFAFQPAKGQQQYPQEQRKAALFTGWYLFRPEVIYPASGSSRQLTSGFELRFSADSLFCYLPYQGRAFNTTYGSRDGGLDFTSTDFGLKEEKMPKGERKFILKPKEQRDIREISITFYVEGDSGYAYVQVFFNQKQPVSYRGQIVREQ